MSRPTMQTLIGYGPRYAVENSGQFNMSHRLLLQGDERKYELWEVRFLGNPRTHKLYDTIIAKMAEPVNSNKNAKAYMVQFLDDRSLSLIIRDANNDGRKALNILREHFPTTWEAKSHSLVYRVDFIATTTRREHHRLHDTSGEYFKKRRRNYK